MALWKSCALLFATLARRCALGADDDVNRDAVETYFDLDAYEDDYRYLDDEMTSNKVPYHTNAPVMVADTCATLTTMWRMAMSTTGSSRGGHGQGIVDEQEAGLTVERHVNPGIGGRPQLHA
ncbi:unnamed protein product (mitochondrion) [Plasmodiophora brassicae]|uniref:Uncharacterized protein n=1 Tax=Plasmodiophora brassicae TaxID=37360 RepID=A0A3P3YGE8_PLABS|nr:unnamed protein product [Plasmodiophora brassicae]